MRSSTWRNAARSCPMSMNAAWRPGSTRVTLPRTTSPTLPASVFPERSMWSSAMIPFSMSATRVSLTSTLMTSKFLAMTGQSFPLGARSLGEPDCAEPHQGTPYGIRVDPEDGDAGLGEGRECRESTSEERAERGAAGAVLSCAAAGRTPACGGHENHRKPQSKAEGQEPRGGGQADAAMGGFGEAARPLVLCLHQIPALG